MCGRRGVARSSTRDGAAAGWPCDGGCDPELMAYPSAPAPARQGREHGKEPESFEPRDIKSVSQLSDRVTRVAWLRCGRRDAEPFVRLEPFVRRTHPGVVDDLPAVFLLPPHDPHKRVVCDGLVGGPTHGRVRHRRSRAAMLEVGRNERPTFRAARHRPSMAFTLRRGLPRLVTGSWRRMPGVVGVGRSPADRNAAPDATDRTWIS